MESWFGEALGFAYDQLIRNDMIGFPAVHTEADFRAPCRFGDKLCIEVRLASLGRTSLTLAYEVRQDSPDAPAESRLSGQTVCAVMDLNPEHEGFMRAVALPEHLRQAMLRFGPMRI